MGVVALKTEAVANRGVFALCVSSYYGLMALGTIDHVQSLLMRDILYIGMAINAIQITVDRRIKLFIIYIEGKLAFVNLFFLRGRDDHLKPLFWIHLEDIAGPMAPQTHLVLEGE
jgi:hypothetical protein